MSRVLPLIKKTASKKNIMLQQPMEMDLGLGSLPDLFFGEELAAVQQPQDEEQKRREPLCPESSKSLFEELEAFNTGWKEDFELDAPIQMQEECVAQKGKKAPSLNILEQAVSECDIFSDDTQLPLIPLDDADDTQNLINEMEGFLVQHESCSSTAISASQVNINTQLTESESKQAEEILDALIAGNISLDLDSLGNGSSPNDVSMEAEESGYLSNISNISEFVTEEGQKVVIVIANDVDPEVTTSAVTPPRPLKPIMPKSPSTSSLSSEGDSDPEWAPSPGMMDSKSRELCKGGRVTKSKGAKRGPYKRAKSCHTNIIDKKERKKKQNVVAARRYRDKKKAEANQIGSEESQVMSKNAKLKAELGEMENEVKTLKKLMKELGLVK